MLVVVRNPNPAPTAGQTRCAGISLIISHACLAAMVGLFGIDYNFYDVDTPQDLIDMHNVLNSKRYKRETMAVAVFAWISFPFFIMGLFGWMKYWKYIFFNTPLEIVVYIIEKAYLMWMLVVTIIIPALALVLISHDWSDGISDDNINVNNIPAGYYNQLQITIYLLELIDCVSIAEACVILALFICYHYMAYKASTGNRKWKEFVGIIIFCKKPINIKIAQVIFFLMILAFTIVFAFIMFEFAEYGLFAPDSRLKFVLGFELLAKFKLSFEMAFIYPKPTTIAAAKRMFDQTDDDGAGCLDTKHDTADMKQTIT